MGCNRACYDNDWKYGEISCSDCPWQDNNISRKKQKELLEKLEKKI